MIRKEGYPAEAHVVLTEDGYILTMHRIPGKPGSPAILLQHGVLGSSADWVILGKEKALAYLLADRGYDVWFGNFRGNTYSRAHVSLSISDLQFWEFSWHESGIYDLPAMITYIVKVKQCFLRAYIGFSMGTTCFYVMSSERPQIARLVQSMYSLAPVGFMKHVQSPLRYLAPFANNIKLMLYLFGEGEFLPQNAVLKFLAKYMCYVDFLEEKICANSIFVIVGFDQAQFNYTLLPVILNHTPAGTSSKTLVHYAQEIQSGYFRQFDYGKEKNLQIYNSTVPPKYDLSKITTPIVLFCAENDWLSSPIMQLIRKEGYPVEAHVTETKDGYILTMHRIPGKPGAPAIFLQHGLLGSSADWIILGKDKALAYLLADRGYDVWLGNFRGNVYSRAHVSIPTSNGSFWDFSWHESGVYDLPAMISYVVNLTQKPLKAYIGYSMGTTTFYVMSTQLPETAKYFEEVYSLAPVAYMQHVKTALRYMAPIVTESVVANYLLGEGEFLPSYSLLKSITRRWCTRNFLKKRICADTIFFATGFDRAQFNYTLLPTILKHTPAGTSYKTVRHYAQEIMSGYFRQYDYGAQKNLEVYNCDVAPIYNLSKIETPVTLIYGENDWLATPSDVERLHKELPNSTIYKVPFSSFNHIDFLWAVDARELVYDKILAQLEQSVR
nr:PREDICTED: lipase 3-like isoform X2 [Megachile rotundata]